ncbi:hypothetical protein ACJX0J_026084 [Zea mays]
MEIKDRLNKQTKYYWHLSSLLFTNILYKGNNQQVAIFFRINYIIEFNIVPLARKKINWFITLCSSQIWINIKYIIHARIWYLFLDVHFHPFPVRQVERDLVLQELQIKNTIELGKKFLISQNIIPKTSIFLLT